MLRKASKALDKTEDILAGFGGVILLFITAIVVMEIFSRMLFNYSFLWINEITEYSLLYLPFLAGAWLVRTNGHIVIDIVDMVFKGRVLKILNVIASFVGMIVSTVLVVFGIEVLMDLYQRDVRSITVLKIPQIYVYCIIPLGSFIMALEFLRKLYQAFTKTSNFEGQSTT